MEINSTSTLSTKVEKLRQAHVNLSLIGSVRIPAKIPAIRQKYYCQPTGNENGGFVYARLMENPFKYGQKRPFVHRKGSWWTLVEVLLSGTLTQAPLAG